MIIQDNHEHPPATTENGAILLYIATTASKIIRPILTKKHYSKNDKGLEVLFYESMWDPAECYTTITFQHNGIVEISNFAIRDNKIKIAIGWHPNRAELKLELNNPLLHQQITKFCKMFAHSAITHTRIKELLEKPKWQL